jgi:hypothetical protein
MLLCTLQLASETLHSQSDQLRQQGHFASFMSTGQAPGTFLPVLSRSQILLRRIALFSGTGTVAACTAIGRRNAGHIPQFSVAV